MSGGGAAKPPEIHYEVRDEIGGRGVVHGYGMTEVPMISNGSPHDTDEQLANTDGKPVEGADVRIVPLDGRVAGPDEEGEIRVKGPMVFHGYTDPALNADAFDEDGYFRTGDLGRLRADGHLTLTGRLKDVIVRKGENISAKEIEDLLYTHPEVIEVAVIGLPDPERGERVCAVVQLAEGADGLELAEVVAFCREAGLMTQKIPEQLELRTDWPRAGTGKIVKKSLRDEYGRPAVSRPAAASPARPRRASRPDRRPAPTASSSSAPATSAARPWPRSSPGPWRPPPRSPTAARSATTSTCAAPARGRGTKASRCTRWPDRAGPGRLPPPRHVAHQIMPPNWVASSSWWPSTAATSRPCAASAPTPTASPCSAPSTPRRVPPPTCPIPTTGTTPSSTSAGT